MIRMRLPPLFSLQVFEAAARLGNFSRAARELHLTQSAVSRQIQVLEDWCGQSLFQRSGPRIQLLPEGAALLQRMEPPLSALHSAVYAHSETARMSLTINTLPSIAQTLLIPALSEFYCRYPTLELTLHTEYGLIQPPPQLAVIAVRHGLQPPINLHAEKLFGDELQPFARADVIAAAGSDPNQWPAELLLQHTQSPWTLWASRCAPELPMPRGVRFNDAALVREAAEAGLGIALLRHSILNGSRESPLIPASALRVYSEQSTYATCRRDSLALPAVQLGLQWLRSLANAHAEGACSAAALSRDLSAVPLSRDLSAVPLSRDLSP